jgi:MYXO-CTERM domain-containing protein
LVLLAASGTAAAGTITSVGAVTALTDLSQMKSITGAADFDEGPLSGEVPANQYAALGLTWQEGPLTQILPGSTTPGSAFLPVYQSGMNYFPAPIAGGGAAALQYVFFAGAATFSSKVTQVGLTASINATQYLTVWNAAGQMLGQVAWTPTNTAAFVGIDSLGVPIAMVAYGNDDLWAGGTFDVGGSTTINDTWVWGPGECSTTADCNDGNPCTDDACSAPNCVFTPNSVPCDDGSACTSSDVCAGGACSGVAVECDDGDDCTLDVCDAVLGCVHGSACDDANDCTDDSCDAISGCAHAPNSGASCDDEDACTEDDVCSAGVCAGTSKSCDDDKPCTDDSCDPATGCQHIGKTGPCDDDNACTTGETCSQGICGGGTPVSCDDHNECTTDSCVPTIGCAHAGREGPCGDATACAAGYCMSGSCSAPVPVDCDDDDPCTQDSCGEPNGCTHTPLDACCHTDADCGGSDECGKDNRCGPMSEGASSAGDSGCSCGTPGPSDDRARWVGLVALALAALRPRFRRRRRGAAGVRHARRTRRARPRA